jgi:hypothetical protein
MTAARVKSVRELTVGEPAVSSVNRVKKESVKSHRTVFA